MLSIYLINRQSDRLKVGKAYILLPVLYFGDASFWKGGHGRIWYSHVVCILVFQAKLQHSHLFCVWIFLLKRDMTF